MNLLSVEGVGKTYQDRPIFENISFGINQGQKIALIAKNGTGKTTLLKIIAGDDAPDKGEVNQRKGTRIAYLAQEPVLNPIFTVEECILQSNSEIMQVIGRYEKALNNPQDEEAYQLAFEAMDQHQAWDFETQYKQILSKLKLDQLQAKVGSLSGGQRKRIALAIVLLEKPDVLILDEPTNHLDLEMIEWLEAYFAKEKFTLLMVTHDRYFLERVCNEIIELDEGKLYTYKGNYSYYLDKRDARIIQEDVEAHKTKQSFKKELEWMRRQPKARTTKSKSRIEDFKVIKEKAHQRRQEHEVQLEINMERLGTKMIEMHKVGKAYGDKIILDQYDYTFQRNDRIGIIGKNGTGKSTFLNLITRTDHPTNGKIVLGETVKFGYYTQGGITIKEGQKVIDVIREFGEFIPLKKGRKISAQQLLERFLFDRKKQYDLVEKLSGGERKRLYLCTVLIQNPNFLILDEPTNDLDIVTLNVLESFLMDFPGCLIVVSHDRYFMDKIVDHLFVFRGDGVIEDFPGNYSDFRSYEDSQPKLAEKEKSSGEKKEWKTPKTTANTLSFSEQKEYNRLEKEIAQLETEKEGIEKQFMDTRLAPETITELSIQLNALTGTIEQKTERWFELSVQSD
ncbi:ABC-F family ATP-binding cassette domain-containing protein [Flavobacteriaceae bacterium]|nr:ABC-F family ATP-binding cassette domain-containing protein [Flavobacteriaceae bacterium]MDA9886372.1 ABC-F family ATP-binding cassette domain-containing protein [Flavobacteriaceae bacterium]MDB4112731.1 ABC-F family ATP-binding cassette domain-containing protein [Flavobacteriaceae bacterium]MDB4186960.1 ABC-F family ATP-binding cassette domain-containing protein [Flavobacteriaceae bacterium]MDB9821482.1 ABC-F family ATP-binding cassette domain-containing protein [Flavobacteriaceae bacterium